MASTSVGTSARLQWCRRFIPHRPTPYAMAGSYCVRLPTQAQAGTLGAARHGSLDACAEAACEHSVPTPTGVAREDECALAPCWVAACEHHALPSTATRHTNTEQGTLCCTARLTNGPARTPYRHAACARTYDARPTTRDRIWQACGHGINHRARTTHNLLT